MKILIIEDESAIRETLQELLELNGYEVLAAADGAEGLKLVPSRPDFIFCDVSMPVMDGYAVLEAIRRSEEWQSIPFVFLTAKADRSDQRRGMALGADDYITKPFSEKEILDAIAARTRRHRSLQERLDELTQQRRRQVEVPWSHELLTPLNGILGGLELLALELEPLGRPDLDEILAVIRGGAQRQEKLSRKIIRYFELENLKTSPAAACSPACRADLAVAAAVRKVMADSPRAKDVTLGCDPAAVALRESFLEDAVAELVSNALSFSKAGSHVQVSGQIAGSHYRIDVVDQGPGMSAAERAAVAAFTQFGRERREQQGLGLGLAIAQAAARLAGGVLLLTDGPNGRGLRATISLPLG